MGMVKTQFVKYAKKSNKHLHRVRGKITHRRVKKAGLRKVFTMQKGGKRHVICEEKASFLSKTGISIEYDDKSGLYYIGKKPYGDLKSNTRYTNALAALKAIGFIPSLEENIVLNPRGLHKIMHQMSIPSQFADLILVLCRQQQQQKKKKKKKKCLL
jgi:hypothetical protein